MDDSFGEFNATQTATAGGATSEQRAEGIAPVLIKQLLDSPETSFSMFGMNFGIVCCAAIVRSIESTSTKITYQLEDHTGRIAGHYWLEDSDDANTVSPDIMINNYAKVFGCLRLTGSDKTLMIFRILNIKDPNEISTHILEAMNARFKAEEYSKESAGFFGSSGSSAVGGVSDQPMDTGIASGLDPKQRMIYEAIRKHPVEEGIGRKELHMKFNKLSEREVNSILDSLSAEGHIYSSFDSDHFLCTE